jgi:predicted thioredoxin/glutaredoxin
MNKILHDVMITATDDPIFNKAGYYWSPEYVEKFAKLVVVEFIREVYKFQDETGSNSQDEAFGNAQFNLFGDD